MPLWRSQTTINSAKVIVHELCSCYRPLCARSQIEEKMAEVTRNEDRVVFIKGDSAANYGSVVEAVNIIRSAGIDRIGLVADKQKGGGEAAAPAGT